MADTGKSEPSSSKGRTKHMSPAQIRLINLLRDPPKSTRIQLGGDKPPPRPPRPHRLAPRQPLPTNRSALKLDFSLENLEQLKRNVNRGGLKGTGDFGKVIDLAKKLYDKKVDTPEKETLIVDALVKSLKSYLEARPGPTDGSPRVFKDEIERRKLEGAQAMLRQAQLRQQDLLNARYGPALLSTEAGVREQAVSEYATAMSKAFGNGEPFGGTSDVYLIKNGGGEVGFAFKSVEGETSQTGMPKGSGAVRESMASTFSETIRQQTGLDFGFPKVDITSLGGRQGALVEGMTGQVLSLEALSNRMGDGKISGEQFMQSRALYGQIADRTPPKQLQKALLCNLALAQFDIKWDNLMVDEANGGVVRPFDAGAGFPPKENLKRDVNKIKVPGSFLINNPFTNKRLPVADEPLDPELVEKFLSINVDNLELALQRERERLAREQHLSPELIDDEALQSGLASTRIIQEILHDTPEITTGDFLEAYGERMQALVN